jgi:hypothetical protein
MQTAYAATHIARVAVLAAIFLFVCIRIVAPDVLEAWFVADSGT